MKREKSLIKRWISLIAILAALVVVVAIVPTLARYIRGTKDVPNDFESAGSDNPTVNADWTITVEDKGYPVYVRAEVLVTWQKDGDVLYLDPKVNKDYVVSYYDEWKPITHDEGTASEKTYYYYMGSNDDSQNGIVLSGGKTSALMTYKSLNTNPPIEGYQLHVEVIVQTVQAVGKTDAENEADEILAWWDAWGLSESDFE